MSELVIAPQSQPTPVSLAPHIQHTLIDASTTRDRMLTHLEECVQFGFNAAMVAGSWVSLAASELAGTGIEIASALDFPIVGTMTSAGKAAEAAELARLGATQIDIGVQIGWLKSGMFAEFRDDIAQVVSACGVPVKVMLELPLLAPSEREAAVELSLLAGAAYLKNASSGAVEIASTESIHWLVERAPDGVGVKASGGIKSYEHAASLIAAGATLVGTTSGIAIVTASTAPQEGNY